MLGSLGSGSYLKETGPTGKGEGELFIMLTLDECECHPCQFGGRIVAFGMVPNNFDKWEMFYP